MIRTDQLTESQKVPGNFAFKSALREVTWHLLAFRHVRSALEHDALVDTKTWRGYGASKNSRWVHDYASTCEHVARELATDDDDVGFDLGFDFGAGVDDQRVFGEDLAFELSANSNCALESQATLERSAQIKKGRQLTAFDRYFFGLEIRSVVADRSAG